MERTAQTSPRRTAKVAGLFYVVTFVAGSLALLLRGPLGVAAGLVAGASYVVVTVLFYFIFKPVSRGLSLLAALVGLAGCAIGPLTMSGLISIKVSPLVFFGFYCLLIAYLVFRSAFLPRGLGMAMAIAGLGWLTYLSPAFAKQLFPYNMIPGIAGEAVLTLWLLVVGVDAVRWNEQAGATPKPA